MPKNLTIQGSHTARGFSLLTFEDRYGAECSIQKSSLASEEAIWIGVEDARRLTGTGHSPRPVPSNRTGLSR